MAATIMLDGPLPAEGEKWCVVCARLFKGAFLGLERVQRLIREMESEPASKVVHLEMEFPRGQRPVLNVAVTTCVANIGPFQFTAGQNMNAPAGVCWSHFEGLVQKEGIVPFSATDMPAGIPLLGQRR
jgi:hypothetical protein